MSIFPPYPLRDGIVRLCKSDADIAAYIHPRIDEVINQLEKYIAEIVLFNPIYGLVSYKEQDELIIRHILDSLAPLGILIRALQEFSAAPQFIADVGSGAGLPGIPLAIALPDAKWTLIEKMQRRADFLLNVTALLKLHQVSVEPSPVENTEGFRFDMICFRAFQPLSSELLNHVSRLLKKGGIIAAYKGKAEKIQQELSRIKNVPAEYRAIRYTVPFMDEERHIMLGKKYGH
ncbi:MAG: 16S rRNA (guanine(527)-N(7))-methyltransferase RsmG [Spirochaetaceae bacterium]|jgi:16S rRNA (guanine527-N7)-methyltransferase|nr:16S rRNA (guanine(527)-N(7))-methyltransferase RsmG [Spirochaetaceae bacterium]